MFRFFTLVLLFICPIVIAQSIELDREYHLSATIFDEHIAVPFEVRKDAPTHLGGTLAFEMSRKRESSYQFTHIFQTGYYYHKNFNQVAFLAWKPKFELRFANSFNIHTIIGIGYAHSFPVRQNYQLEDGGYIKKTNWGKPHAMPSIGFGAGVNLDKLINMPITVFGRYEAFSLAPYALKGKVPITINTMLSFGIKCKL